MPKNLDSENPPLSAPSPAKHTQPTSVETKFQRYKHARIYLISKWRNAESQIRRHFYALAGKNPFSFFHRVSPNWIGLIALMIGVLLLLLSFWSGAYSIQARIEFLLADGSSTAREIHVGFWYEPQYALWYLMPCPFLFVLLSLSLQSLESGMKSKMPYRNYRSANIDSLISFWGWVIVLFCFAGNVWDEYKDFWGLGIGWFRTPLIAKMKSGDSFASGAYFLPQVINGTLVYVKSACLAGSPDVKLKSQSAFWVLVGVTIGWRIIWQSLVAYVTVFAIARLYQIAYLFKIEEASSAEDGFYGIGWTLRPAYCIFSSGVVLNLFYILRAAGLEINGAPYVNKDMVYLFFSPPVAMLIWGGTVINRIVAGPPPPKPDSQKIIFWNYEFGILSFIWLCLLGFLGFLYQSYLHPGSHATASVSKLLSNIREYLSIGSLILGKNAGS